MPSIPQSLLWISLVVLWLFVLVPMLIGKRDAVRRTSDVALATRVLNSAAGLRLRRRTGPAAGHRSDPEWQPVDSQDTDPNDDLDDDEDEVAGTRSAVMTVAVAAKVEVTETEHLDTDVIDDDAMTMPVGSTEVTDQMLAVVVDQVEAVVEQVESVVPAESATIDAEVDADHAQEVEPEVAADDEADSYEYVEDTSGLEAEDEPPTTVTPVAPRRRRCDSATTAAAVSARKFRFRKRAVTMMVLSLAVSAALAYLVTPTLWWVCGGVAGVTLLYLAYLRRQTRIEQRVRRRRMQRMARSRYGVENTHDQELDVIPSRLRRPGAVVLEIDEEDPIFEHLDYAPVAHEYHLPRAAGQ